MRGTDGDQSVEGLLQSLPRCLNLNRRRSGAVRVAEEADDPGRGLLRDDDGDRLVAPAVGELQIRWAERPSDRVAGLRRRLQGRRRLGSRGGGRRRPGDRGVGPDAVTDRPADGGPRLRAPSEALPADHHGVARAGVERLDALDAGGPGLGGRQPLRDVRGRPAGLGQFGECLLQVAPNPVLGDGRIHLGRWTGSGTFREQFGELVPQAGTHLVRPQHGGQDRTDQAGLAGAECEADAGQGEQASNQRIGRVDQGRRAIVRSQRVGGRHREEGLRGGGHHGDPPPVAAGRGGQRLQPGGDQFGLGRQREADGGPLHVRALLGPAESPSGSCSRDPDRDCRSTRRRRSAGSSS